MTEVGWRLAEEIAWARPQRPGPEWWTLMDIAQDAKDETRQGWPGRDYLAARAKKSTRTIDRYVDALVRDGKLVVVCPAAPGRRPVYEIPVLFELPGTCDTMLSHVPVDNPPPEPVENPATCDTMLSHVPTCDTAERETFPGPTCDTQCVSHPPSYTPVTTKSPVDNRSLEGEPLSTGEPSGGIATGEWKPRGRHARKDTDA